MSSIRVPNLAFQSARLIIAACVLFVFLASAEATAITAGHSITAVGQNNPVGGSLVPGTGSPLPVSSDTFSGTLTSSVVAGDTSNPYGGLTFTYLLSNDLASSDAIGRITINSFAGFLTDVSFQSPGAGVQPTLSDRSNSGNTIGFTFVGPPLSGLGELQPGQSATLLVVQTNATHFASTTAQLIDGSVTTVASFGPTAMIPEPSTLVLTGFGLAAFCVAAYRRRWARSSTRGCALNASRAALPEKLRAFRDGVSMSPNENEIVGRAASTNALRERIRRVARFPSGVLISGPSGTGKELVARAIHRHSPRASQPFVSVDCTSLSGDLFASQLFGHVKGAFTGADYERIGCFRAADGGTILLDEIGELSPDLQSNLLRTIQERVVVPVGSDRPIPIDVRIVAATNRDLEEEVRSGGFRLDLYYRLNVVALKTVPLRDRVEDIEPLADFFLNKMAAEQGYPHKRLSEAVLAVLQAYPWPGNVRQLQNALELAVVFAAGDVLDLDSLPTEIVTAVPDPARDRAPSLPPRHAHWPTLADVEREHIRLTLDQAFHNQSAAADLLKINRVTLARKIREYQLPRPDCAPPQSTAGRLAARRFSACARYLLPPCAVNVVPKALTAMVPC